MSEDRAQKTPQYDADAEQVIEVIETRRIDQALKAYTVRHTLAPCADIDYLTFDKNCKVKIVIHPDKSTETVDSAEEAAVTLYDTLKQRVEGWGPEDGSKVDDEQKRKVILKNFFVCAIVPPTIQPAQEGNADEDRPWEVERAPASDSVGLRCLFNGEEVVTRHFTVQPTAGQKKRHESLTSRKSYVAGARLQRNVIQLPSTAKALGKLYTEICPRAEGYAGRVPLWHQLAIVAYVFGDEEETAGED